MISSFISSLYLLLIRIFLQKVESQVSVAYFLPLLEVMSMSASALTQQTLKGAAEKSLEGVKTAKGG